MRPLIKSPVGKGSIYLMLCVFFTTASTRSFAQTTDTAVNQQGADSLVNTPPENTHHSRKNRKPKADTGTAVVKASPWKFICSIGLNATNVWEINASPGPDQKNLSGSVAIDLGMNYKKDGIGFEMTNELHWLLNIQRSSLSGAAHIQRVTDNLNTLHDFSIPVSKNKKWQFNLIAKTTTSVFTIYDGNYFQDINHLGKIQGFINPYDVTLAPGIKFEPDKYLRISLSPYSVDLYGLQNQQIANTGLYTHDSDANHNYVRFVFKQLGTEINIWYDRQIGKWLEIQYRLGISSSYVDKIGKNGLVDGLFLTKIHIIKNLELSHRATLTGDFATKPFKPYYSQTIVLSYTKSF